MTRQTVAELTEFQAELDRQRLQHRTFPVAWRAPEQVAALIRQQPRTERRLGLGQKEGLDIALELLRLRPERDRFHATRRPRHLPPATALALILGRLAVVCTQGQGTSETAEKSQRDSPRISWRLQWSEDLSLDLMRFRWSAWSSSSSIRSVPCQAKVNSVSTSLSRLCRRSCSCRRLGSMFSWLSSADRR